LIFLLRQAHTPTAAIAKQARLKRTQIFIFRPPPAANTELLDFLAEAGPSANGHDDKTKAYPDVHTSASRRSRNPSYFLFLLRPAHKPKAATARPTRQKLTQTFIT
jgi:hypothetical protein